MNTTALTLLATLMISAMIIAMLIMQARHRQLAAARDRLHALGTQYRKLNNILHTLPGAYLTPELKDFLYQALLQNLKAQIKLSPDQNNLLTVDFEALSAERIAVKNKGSHSSTPFPAQADEASLHRQTLKSLYLFIKRNFDTGRLNANDANKLLSQVEYKLIETAVEYFRQRGMEATKNRNYREARIAFQKALDAIQTSKQASEFKQEEIALRQRLNHVVAKWREHRVLQSKGQADKLAEGVGNLIDDQDSWKKKNLYD